MRLLYKHSYYNLVTNLAILLLGGMIFYCLFNYIIDRNIRATLNERRDFAQEKLALSDSLYIYQNFSYHVFSIKRLPKAFPFSVSEQVKDTAIFDPLRNEASLYRQLTFTDNIRGQPYQITVRRPLIDDFEILRGVVASLLFLAVMLGVALYFSNRLISKKLWKPFDSTLAKLRDYQLNESLAIEFPQTDVTEFNELTEALKRLIERIQTDYYALKEYTENTTHEIQTPLAIIQSKLDLLQEYNLPLEQLQLVHAANQAVTRLSRIKEALLLLVRIKNHQYTNPESLCVSEMIESRLIYFDELMQMKGIRLRKQVHKNVMVVMNPVLAEVLLDNLISNAIKYNIPDGEVIVELVPGTLIIRNTGEAPRVPTTAFFDRFVKADPQSKSLGLGLAIVKAICDTNSLGVEYHFTNGYHTICIFFPATPSL